MKKRFPILLLLAAALSACSKKEAPAPEAPEAPRAVKNPDTFTYLTISDIDSLDPAWSYDTASHEAILQVYETLVFYKGSSLTELEPVLATKVPSLANGLISKDGRTYRFPIRKGVRFHDGTPMTPEDVRFSLLRFCLYDRDGGPSELLLDPIIGRASSRAGGKPDDAVYAALADAVRVEGDDVVVKLHEPFSPFLTILTQWAPVLSRDWSAKNGDWDGTEAAWKKHNNPKKEDSPYFDRVNGTGPFKLERWSKETKELVMVRHDGYWREPAAIKRFITRGVDEIATRIEMLKAGDADSVYIDRTVFSQVKDIPGVQIIDDLPTVEMNPIVFFTFETDPVANTDIGSGKLDGQGIPPDFFSDLDLRRAFAYAVDYRGYIQEVERGKGTQARGVVPKGLLGYDESIPVFSYDPKKAEEHFKKAYGGQVWEKGFYFTLTYNQGNRPREVIANMIKRNVEALNPKFKLDTRPVQWSTYLGKITAHKLPVFIMGWAADYPDPHNFAFPQLHQGAHWPEIQRFKDAELTAMIEEAKRELDPGKRHDLYVRIQKRAHELVPQLYLINKVVYRSQRDWVQGWSPLAVWPSQPYSSPMYPIWKGYGEKPAPAAGAS